MKLQLAVGAINDPCLVWRVTSCLEFSHGRWLEDEVLAIVGTSMTDSRRSWLIDSLQKHLVPAFEERGFEVVPLAGEEAKSRELQSAFPFGYLKRASERGIDLVEIQLDKRGAAKFRLNIGVAPEGGINHAIAGHIKQEDIRVHYLGRAFEACSSPIFRRWFAVRRPWSGTPPTKKDYENLVADNLGLVREVEDVLSDGILGRHLRVVEW